eukprot:TRINITY_DN1144_c0_g4_i1.p1 TRINITY_DN1144_c0_g4~~TRINITY_DN1144_c0_g4_i1.p1  ORF type:complete len:208 (+),score=61.67 TRINITY_DN1144_c0_g4_i1:69-692(+)
MSCKDDITKNGQTADKLTCADSDMQKASAPELPMSEQHASAPPMAGAVSHDAPPKSEEVSRAGPAAPVGPHPLAPEPQYQPYPPAGHHPGQPVQGQPVQGQPMYNNHPPPPMQQGMSTDPYAAQKAQHPPLQQYTVAGRTFYGYITSVTTSNRSTTTVYTEVMPDGSTRKLTVTTKQNEGLSSGDAAGAAGVGALAACCLICCCCPI